MANDEDGDNRIILNRKKREAKINKEDKNKKRRMSIANITGGL